MVARLLASFCIFAGAGFAELRTAVFEPGAFEAKWSLKELNPAIPSDWTPFNFLVLEMRGSSPQRFELRVFDAAGLRRVRIHPLPGAWVRAAVPLRYLKASDRQGHDLASLSNKPRSTFWVNLGGAQGPLDHVAAIGVAMENPLGRPTLEIRSVAVEKDDPGDAFLDKEPLIDEFGQWIHAEWPGKIRSLAELKKAWDAESRELEDAATEYCEFGGFRGMKAKATGYFRVEQVDGRWWFVDPDGHLFLSTGADATRATGGTRTEGRESAYTALPPAEVNDGAGASFHSWNLLRRFGPDWKRRWVDFTLRRHRAWGFNTIGNWADSALWDAKKVAYTVPLRGWGTDRGIMGMPDLYSAEWEEAVDRAASEQCAPRKNDPYLLGYFVANEPPWPGKEVLVVQAILDGPASATREHLSKFLISGDTAEHRREWVLRAFERFVSVTGAAIRRHDPNHLNLGMRFGSHAPDGMIAAGRAFDVYSFNSYVYEVSPADIDRAAKLSGRPVMIGEFHFGTTARGLAAGLRQTANQFERGVAYRYYVENAMAHPAMLGAHWFQWADQPPTGRNDGENYNIGLVDVTDQPYRELIEAAKTTHGRLRAIHAGAEAPVKRQAKVN